MDRKLTVNDLLPNIITKINSNLVPADFQGDARSLRNYQDNLTELIDTIGRQSAACQGLAKVITTTEKLRRSPSHFLYLVKDADSNNGDGEVIGMLKVGRKHLFLFDARDHLRDMEPLCVLDFYVVGHRQRHGYGRMLFDYMLHDLEITADDIPVDGPSANMERFLSKNYGLVELVRQNNNFAVSPRFFRYNTGGGGGGGGGEEASGHSGRETPNASAAVGRFSAHKPPSVIGNVIHGEPVDNRDAGPGYTRFTRSLNSL